MADNIEPSQSYLRLKDLLAWMPQITPHQLRKWKSAGILHPIQITPGAPLYYRKREIKKIYREDDAVGK